MNIYAKEGDKVIVTEESLKNGYDYVEEHARKFLKIGETYTVSFTVVDSWSTNVYLKEFPGEIFNSVSFKDDTLPEMEKKVKEDGKVLIYYKNHLVKKAQNLKLDEIELRHIKGEQPRLLKADIVVLKLDGNYKVLKCRY